MASLDINSKVIILILTFFAGTISLSHGQSMVDTSMTMKRIVILFDSDKTSPQDSFLLPLNKICEMTSVLDSFSFIINAHTDNIGNDSYNEKLSQNRMMAIANILTQLGIKESLISSEYHGERKPLKNNANASNRQLNRRVELDLIVPMQLRKIKTRVIDKASKNGLSSMINLESSMTHEKYNSDSTGYAEVIYPIGGDIKISAHAKNYLSNELSIKSNILNRLDSVIINLSPMKEGSKFSLKGLNFVGNKCIILNRSIAVLHELKDFMLVNDDKCIRIGGHVNYADAPKVPESHIYFDLSRSRAQVVYDSLRTYGIDKSRMYAKGYGNGEMLFPKSPTEAQQTENRRVEITVESCETTKDKINDKVFSPQFHGYIVLNKFYSKVDFDHDSSTMLDLVKVRLNNKIQQVSEKGLDPEMFTYLQLLKM